MPSFDVVSELDAHEVNNALDQASREIQTRFDFKGSNSKYEQKTKEEKKDCVITLTAESDFQLKQMVDILTNKLVKRGVDTLCMKVDDPEFHGKVAEQKVTLKQGLDTEEAKKVVKLIKEAGLKVQAAIQGDQVRVTGKKRDDLQDAIAMLREAKLTLPVQFTNFRD